MSCAPQSISSVSNCQLHQLVDFLSTHASVVEHAKQIQLEGCIVEYITGNVKFD